MDGVLALRSKFLELTDVFADVCASAGVRWWLWGGSCLGALRHGGFIPWDDDFDVCVMADDIPKLVAPARWPDSVVFAESFSCTMFCLHMKGTYMHNMPDPKWTSELARGKPVGVHIDVFPLFNVPSDRQAALAFQRLVVNRMNGSFEQVRKAHEGTGFLSTLLMTDDHVPDICFAGESRLITFESRRYPVPPRAEQVMTCLYGPDYMTPRRAAGAHGHFVDLDHGWEEYASGRLRLPERHVPSSPGCDVMFA